MSRYSAPDGGPIEVHLPDGGHVILAFDGDDDALGSDCDELIPTLLHAGATEHDVEEAIRTQASELGLDCATSTVRHSTRIVIRRF